MPIFARSNRRRGKALPRIIAALILYGFHRARENTCACVRNEFNVERVGEIAEQLRTWVPWSELTGTPRGTLPGAASTSEEVFENVSLIACAKLGIGFQFGPEAETSADLQTTGFWARLLLPPGLSSEGVLLRKARSPRLYAGANQVPSCRSNETGDAAI